jgi:hypothetical protein
MNHEAYPVAVLNRRSPSLSDPLPGVHRVYIGRPTILGNPFPLKREEDRDLVCNRYMVWLKRSYKSNPAVARELHRLVELSRSGPLELVCYCAPLRCHGDSVREAILRLRGDVLQ